MDLSQIMELMPSFIAAGTCIELRGRSGIGKTDMCRQFAWDWGKKLGHPVGIGSPFFATYTPPDVTGFLMPRTLKVTMADGTVQEQTISEWSAPAWMRADPGQEHEWLNDFQQAILILEEWDKANVEVKKAAAPLLLYGGVGGWFLKKSTGRIILSNHADDGRQGSTKDFDFTINRRFIFHVTQSVRSWVDWAIAHDLHPLFIAFASEHAATVFGSELPKEQGPFITGRSLAMLESVAKRTCLDVEGRVTNEDAFMEMAHASIGPVATRDLITFFKFRDEVPSWDEIVKSPGSAKVTENAGAQLMAAHICAYNVDAKTMDAAVAYVRRIRKDFWLVFAKAATKRNFRLVSTKAFVKWTSEEPSLVALINAIGGAR